MTTDLVHIPFHGGSIVAIERDGVPYISVRHVCESLGIDVRSQLRKLQSRSWAVVVKMTMTAADGKNYETAAVDRRTLTMWLATLNATTVSPESRGLLEHYQSEAADALDSYFSAGVAVQASDLSTLDVLRAAIDQIEATQRTAAEAKAIATTTSARLDAIEGRHDWFAALGFARTTGMKDTSNAAMRTLGAVAGRIARAAGITPVKVQHAMYGPVNSFPRWIWEQAADELALTPDWEPTESDFSPAIGARA